MTVGLRPADRRRDQYGVVHGVHGARPSGGVARLRTQAGRNMKERPGRDRALGQDRDRGGAA